MWLTDPCALPAKAGSWPSGSGPTSAGQDGPPGGAAGAAADAGARKVCEWEFQGPGAGGPGR